MEKKHQNHVFNMASDDDSIHDPQYSTNTAWFIPNHQIGSQHHQTAMSRLELISQDAYI